MKHLVIIGGGFGGVNLAREMANQPGYTVTLVDRNNYNFFPPLLYQLATGYLEPSNICYPFRKFLRGKDNIHFRLGELEKVMPAEKKVQLSCCTLDYDYLVIATGTVINHFGLENVKQNALSMKTVDDALKLRNHFLRCLEQAVITTCREERKKLLTIAVTGGGPTGVEVSGMLAELRLHTIPKDYPELKSQAALSSIYLIDSNAQLLSPMSKESQQHTYEALTKMGVRVKLNCRVKDYVNDEVRLSTNETIDTKTLVWTAGVTGSPIEGIPAACYGHAHRLTTDAYNEVIDLPGVFAIGDACIQTTDPAFPMGHPQLAQVALQQGKNLAHNFVKMEKQGNKKPFTYYDKGSMAVIGTNKAVADLPRPKLHLKGFIAWLIWIFVHLMFLVNYRNRLRTLFNWVGAYISRDQSLRLMIRPEKMKQEGDC